MKNYELEKLARNLIMIRRTEQKIIFCSHCLINQTRECDKRLEWANPQDHFYDGHEQIGCIHGVRNHANLQDKLKLITRMEVQKNAHNCN